MLAHTKVHIEPATNIIPVSRLLLVLLGALAVFLYPDNTKSWKLNLRKLKKIEAKRKTSTVIIHLSFYLLFLHYVLYMFLHVFNNL